jgi:TolB-like protein/DNA-binding winged helix-turn-helix (wHTH) protein
MTGVYRFGSYELDPATGELRRSGVRIRLQDQPMRILEALLETRGALVTREELRERIWGDTFVDFDRALNTAIRKLREALNDSADAPRYIETIPKRGYRFLAPVEQLEGQTAVARETPAAGPAPSAGEVVEGSDGRRVRLPLQWIAAAILLLVVGGSMALFLRASSAGVDSLAVLPFANLTGSAANEFVADGITETLIADLGNLQSLRVISRTSSMRYKSSKKALPEIAGELRVDALVEGSLVRFGDRARVEVKLVDADRDALLWSAKYERPAAELDTLQREMAAAVAGALRSRFATSPKAPDAEALLMTMKGRYWLSAGRDGKVAREFLRQAIEKDATYAAPYAALAEADIFIPEETTPPRAALSRAKMYAAKAIALDPDLAEGHTSMAMVLMFLDRDFDASERAFQRALELKPGAGEIHHRYGQLLAAMGRLDAAIVEARKAAELDPFSTLAIDDYGRSLYFARRYDEAIAQYERSLAVDDGDLVARWFKLYALVSAGRDGEAVTMIEEMMHAPFFGGPIPNLRELYASGGYGAVARVWADNDARKAEQTGFVRSTGIAVRYAQAGDRDLAFQWLERAYESHTRDLVFLNVEPHFDPIRSDPRFKAFVRKVGLP